ncbi:MAG: metallophosphoesterase family protein [Halobacteriota archaeon]
MSRAPRFDEGVSHWRLDSEAYDDIYVVGDVHGSRRVFERLLETLDLGPSDLLVAVGDLVRKGPDSKGVVDIVRERDNIVSVRGNNEQKLIDGDSAVPTLSDEDLAWLADLPAAISWDDALVVHGGVHPSVPLSAHDTAMLTTMRAPAGSGYDGPFWFDVYRGSPRVFFGHTVLETPIEREWAVGLDTGCVYGGQLTAYDWREEEFIAVDATTTHRDRPAEKFVSPPPIPSES